MHFCALAMELCPLRSAIDGVVLDIQAMNSAKMHCN